MYDCNAFQMTTQMAKKFHPGYSNTGVKSPIATAEMLFRKRILMNYDDIRVFNFRVAVDVCRQKETEQYTSSTQR